MIRKKRGYKRETRKDLLRDYKLFAIACEGGKREPQYFQLFEFLSTRIKVDIIEDKIQDEEFKTEISSFDIEGYNPLNFITLIKNAVSNAKNLDNNPNSDLPSIKETKVYKLVESILTFVSENQFIEFVEKIHPKLIKENSKKETKLKVNKIKKNVSKKK